MGEVYRARDTRLQRDVALKVIPDLLTADVERLARFEREAQVLASLNHPHIAAIYGLEQARPSAGSGQPLQFLVLELVEGGTLADRLEKAKPSNSGSRVSLSLSLTEVLSIAKQIADGLQAAHEKGIIHRDLKPSNIALTHDGQVKVLDFGLAKLEANDPVEPASAGSNAETMPPLAGLSKSPTMSPAAMTSAGMILGTAAYMSPEQAKGRPADKRSDVWAFGCVLYEMLAGKAPFDGEDISDTLANVLKAEPDWTAIPSSVPEAIRTLVRKCLDKDRRTRIADISVASFILDDPEVLGGARTDSDTAAVSSSWRDRIAIATAALMLGGGLSGALVWYARRPAAKTVSRLAITTTAANAFRPADNDRELASSPDGQRVAYVGGGRTIFVRSLDRLEPTAITGVGVPRGLFFSPDGQSIGFFDSGILKKVAVTGGSPVTLCRPSGVPRGAAWGPDDTIVFATNDRASGLLSVPGSGGDPTTLSMPNPQNGEADHAWPEFLPDGSGVLFTIVPATSSLENARIAVFDLRNRTAKVLLERGTDAHYVASGHLVYAQGETIRAVAFDLGKLEVRGTAVQVLSQVAATRFGAGAFDVSNTGTLVYQPRIGQVARTLVWVDRQGREEPVPFAPRAFQRPRLSPDGKRAALEIQDDIWIWDVGTEMLRQLTFGPAPNRFPVWTPDNRIVFGSDRTTNSAANLFIQPADGSGAAQPLTESPNQQFPMSVSQDGRWLVFRESAPTLDLSLLSLEQPKQSPRALLNTPNSEQAGEISPDGRWLAYESNKTGQLEIFVKPFPDVGAGEWRVSSDGGIQPVWSRTGQELFYVGSNHTLMAVSIGRGAVWSAGNPAKLFEDRYYHGAAIGIGRTYDVSPDGRRFLMIKQPGGTETSDTTAFIVVQNWLDELKGLVPGK